MSRTMHWFQMNLIWRHQSRNLPQYIFLLMPLTLFRMRGGKKPPPTSFSPETSTNVGFSP